jgi:hypothetical protein
MELGKCCGCFARNIPVFQNEGVTDEQAETATKNINMAFDYLTSLVSVSYNSLIEILKEIQIVTIVNNDKDNYEWHITEKKATIKIQHDITYTDACKLFIYNLSKILNEIKAA